MVKGYSPGFPRARPAGIPPSSVGSVLTTTALFIALAAAGISSWVGRAAGTPAWRDWRLWVGLGVAAVGLAVPAEHFVHQGLLAAATGTLSALVGAEVASTRSRGAAATNGFGGQYVVPDFQYAYVS